MKNIKNRKFKILSFFLALCICLSATLVKAYSSPSSVQIARTDLQYNNYVDGNTYNKNTFGIIQRVYNRKTYTAITNPCSSCKVGIKLKAGSEQRGFATSQMGNTVSLGTYSQIEDNYKLSMARYDFTLLTTYSFGTWYINS